MSTLPTWLEGCRNAILGSAEWESMSHSIYQELLRVLAEDRIGHFSDLSSVEQTAYMGKLQERLSGLDLYPNFMKKLSSIVDEAVTKAADSIGKELFPNRTRLERILEISAAGVATLVSDSPNTTPEKILQQMQILKNVPMTPTLRRLVWRLSLPMPSIRVSFEEYLLSRSEVLKEDELSIADKCKSVLLSTQPDLMSNVALLRTMRVVLMFVDKKITPLRPSHYYCVIPPLICFMQDNPDGASATEYVLEHVVALEKSSYYSRIEERSFSQSVLQKFSEQLQLKDPELHQLLLSIKALDTYEPSPGPKKVAVALIASTFEGVMEEIFRNCFVRICSIPTLMFIWDQLVLSQWEALPFYAVGFLICLRHHLLQCQSNSALSQTVLLVGPHLLQSSLQQVMSAAFGMNPPKTIFEARDVRLDPPGEPSNYKRANFAKFDTDASALIPRRTLLNTKLWRKRARQVAWWRILLRPRPNPQPANA